MKKVSSDIELNSTKVEITNWPPSGRLLNLLPILIALFSVIALFITNENSNKQIMLGRKAFIIAQFIKESKTEREFLQLENVTTNPALDYKLYVLVQRDGDFDTLWVEESGLTIPGRQTRYFYLNPNSIALSRINQYGIWQQDRDLYLIQRFNEYADLNNNLTDNDPPLKLYKYYNLVDSGEVKPYSIINLQDY